MNDLEKEFLQQQARKLTKQSLITQVEVFEKYIYVFDMLKRTRIYTWEQDLYQKITHFPKKLYAYKVDWDGKWFDYYIETDDEISVFVRIQKDGSMEYAARKLYEDPIFIKELHKILKDFVETKKEYRLRIITGAMEMEIDEELQEILEAE